MSTDYHTAQGDFSSIVYRLQPMVLSNFVMWLDLKVAEFKVYGKMLLEAEKDVNSTRWFLQSGLDPKMFSNSIVKGSGCSLHRAKRTATSALSETEPSISTVLAKMSRISGNSEKFSPDNSSVIESSNNFQSEMDLNPGITNESEFVQGELTDEKSTQDKSVKHCQPLKFECTTSIDSVAKLTQNDILDTCPDLTSVEKEITDKKAIQSNHENIPIINRVAHFLPTCTLTHNNLNIRKKLLPSTSESYNTVSDNKFFPVSVDNIKSEPVDDDFNILESECESTRLSACTEPPLSMFLVPNVSADCEDENKTNIQPHMFTQGDETRFLTDDSYLEDDKTAANFLYQHARRKKISNTLFSLSGQHGATSLQDTMKLFCDTSNTRQRGSGGIFGCHRCSYTSIRAGDLRKHVECTHSNNRRHVCDMCGHKYKQASHLYRHKRETCHKILARTSLPQTQIL